VATIEGVRGEFTVFSSIVEFLTGIAVLPRKTTKRVPFLIS
jgi:hypothetical protein